jgi:hypothetical protein
MGQSRKSEKELIDICIGHWTNRALRRSACSSLPKILLQCVYTVALASSALKPVHRMSGRKSASYWDGKERSCRTSRSIYCLAHALDLRYVTWYFLSFEFERYFPCLHKWRIAAGSVRPDIHTLFPVPTCTSFDIGTGSRGP